MHGCAKVIFYMLPFAANDADLRYLIHGKGDRIPLLPSNSGRRKIATTTGVPILLWNSLDGLARKSGRGTTSKKEKRKKASRSAWHG